MNDLLPTPYKNKYHQEIDDEAVEATTETENPEPNDVQTTSDPAPETVEEKTFKKRYGDLRRYHDTKTKELETKVNELSSKLNDKNKSLLLPKTPEEIEAWRNQYPEVFDIVRTIARKEAQDEREELSKKFKDLEDRERNFAFERAYKKLLEKHPDFETIKDTEDFHEWINEQTPEIQAWLYDNDEDYIKASRAVDLYKHDRQIIHKKKDIKEDQVAASKGIKTPVKDPDPKEKPSYKLSEIRRMTPAQFEKHEKEIDKARREGRIEEDI